MGLNAFVSSTYEDLREHRAHVIHALRQGGIATDPMEHWSASSKGPSKLSVDGVDGCDLFVLLVALRRGHVPPGESRSITQQEYDRAVALGIDILVFLLDEGAPWPTEFDELGSDPEVGRWRDELNNSNKHTTSKFFLSPDSIKIRDALIRWLHTAPSPALSFTPELKRDLQRAVELARANAPDGKASFKHLMAAMTSPGHEMTHRFIARREYFGSIIFDVENSDYIPFDTEATNLFELSAEQPLETALDTLTHGHPPKAVQQFIALCRQIGLLDDQYRFAGVFLDQDFSVRGQLSAPTTVHMSLTNACDLQCNYCYASSGEPLPGELSLEEIEALIDEMSTLGCYKLSFGGGEPLLHPQLPGLLEHAYARGVRVSLSTNAMAASRYLVRRLKGAAIDEIKVSVQGATAQVNDAIRGEDGAFARALRGIKELKLLAAPIVMHMVVMKHNAHEVPRLVELANEIGVDQLKLTTVMPVGRAAHQSELILSPAETHRLWDEVASLRDTSAVRIDAPEQLPVDRKWLFEGFGCNCANLVCHVDARGDVSPSGFVRTTIPSDSLRKMSLKQIWDHGEGFVRFRRLMGNDICARCDAFPTCRGGCRARSLHAGKGINQPDPDCPRVI